MKNRLSLLAVATLLASCVNSSTVQVTHQGRVVTLDSTQGYNLAGSDKVTLRSGPGRHYKKILVVEPGDFIGVAGPQSENDSNGTSWLPLKSLESKGVVVGYAPIEIAYRLSKTQHKFSPKN